MLNTSTIENAVRNLSFKFQQLDIKSLNISIENKEYLLKYRRSLQFYMSMYCQLMDKALKKLKKPIPESTFIDYGGGSGLLTFLAKEVGFKTVVYNDLNMTRVKEAEIISKNINCKIDHYIPGDIDDLVIDLNRQSIKPDLICSFDVLEHIYNLESWIKSLCMLNSDFVLVFMTSANTCNPVISRRLRKIQIRSEYEGGKNNIRIGDTFSDNSNFDERKIIIINNHPELGSKELDQLTFMSRGLKAEDIIKMVDHYLETGENTHKMSHPTNTCDPYTGSWTEKLIDIRHLKDQIEKNNLSVEFRNSFYTYSNNKLLNAPKFILNQFIKIIGPHKLFLSPAFTMEIEKLNSD